MKTVNIMKKNTKSDKKVISQKKILSDIEHANRATIILAQGIVSKHDSKMELINLKNQINELPVETKEPIFSIARAALSDPKVRYALGEKYVNRKRRPDSIKEYTAKKIH